MWAVDKPITVNGKEYAPADSKTLCDASIPLQKIDANISSANKRLEEYLDTTCGHCDQIPSDLGIIVVE